MVIFIFIKHAGEHKVEKVCFETCRAIIVSWVLINTPITPPEMFFVPWSGKKPYLLQLLTASYQHLCRMEFKIWASDVFICALQVWGEPGTGWPFSTFCRIKHIWASKNLPGMNRFKWSQNGMLEHIAGGGSLISHELCFQATILHWQNEAGRHSFKCLYACVFLCSQLLVFHGADDHAARTYNVTPKRT